MFDEFQVNPLNVNPTERSKTLKHFVGLALKELNLSEECLGPYQTSLMEFLCKLLTAASMFDMIQNTPLHVFSIIFCQINFLGIFSEQYFVQFGMKPPFSLRIRILCYFTLVGCLLSNNHSLHYWCYHSSFYSSLLLLMLHWCTLTQQLFTIIPTKLSYFLWKVAFIIYFLKSSYQNLEPIKKFHPVIAKRSWDYISIILLEDCINSWVNLKLLPNFEFLYAGYQHSVRGHKDFLKSLVVIFQLSLLSRDADLKK